MAFAVTAQTPSWRNPPPRSPLVIYGWAEPLQHSALLERDHIVYPYLDRVRDYLTRGRALDVVLEIAGLRLRSETDAFAVQTYLATRAGNIHFEPMEDWGYIEGRTTAWWDDAAWPTGRRQPINIYINYKVLERVENSAPGTILRQQWMATLLAVYVHELMHCVRAAFGARPTPPRLRGALDKQERRPGPTRPTKWEDAVEGEEVNSEEGDAAGHSGDWAEQALFGGEIQAVLAMGADPMDLTTTIAFVLRVRSQGEDDWVYSQAPMDSDWLQGVLSGDWTISPLQIGVLSPAHPYPGHPVARACFSAPGPSLHDDPPSAGESATSSTASTATPPLEDLLAAGARIADRSKQNCFR